MYRPRDQGDLRREQFTRPGRATTAAAPADTAESMNWWPSNRSPTRATKQAPGDNVRVSVETLVTSGSISHLQ